QSTLHALSCRCLSRALRQLGDLALQLTVLSDELRDHRIELLDKVAANCPLPSGASCFRSGRTSAAPRCIWLCFLWCHVTPLNKRKIERSNSSCARLDFPDGFKRRRASAVWTDSSIPRVQARAQDWLYGSQNERRASHADVAP